eukprot:7866039-Pyramimonas_sp.AAC.1
MHLRCIGDAARPSDPLTLRPHPGVAGLGVDTNTNIVGVPPPREEDSDLGDGGNILASKVTE